MQHRWVSLTGLFLLVANLASAQVAEQRLFTIPYGKGKDQVAVPPLEDPESDGTGGFYSSACNDTPIEDR